jgi:hypothetical protein
MLDRNNLPFNAKTEGGNFATVLAYDWNTNCFVGLVTTEKGAYTYPRRWNTKGVPLFSDGDENTASASVLVDRKATTQKAFDNLDAETRTLLKSIRQIYATKKITGIRHIRTITGFGLVEAKILFEEIL